MTMAGRALEALNSITLEQYRSTNWWDDVVMELDGYDDVATAAADPYGRSDTVVFEDGSRAVLDGDVWVAR